jgi:hypothetical protein
VLTLDEREARWIDVVPSLTWPSRRGTRISRPGDVHDRSARVGHDMIHRIVPSLKVADAGTGHD